MDSSAGSHAGSGREGETARAEGSPREGEIDWIAAERSPEFRELISKKRSFVIPALGFVFVWYFGFILLAGYAPSFMGERIVGGFTIGYALALTQFLMTWILAAMYLRRADRDFDPLSRKAAEAAIRGGAGGESAAERTTGAGHGGRTTATSRGVQR